MKRVSVLFAIAIGCLAGCSDDESAVSDADAGTNADVPIAMDSAIGEDIAEGGGPADVGNDAGQTDPLIYGTWRVTSFVVTAPDGSVTDYVNFLAPCDQDNDWIFREGEYEVTAGEIACAEGEGILDPWTSTMDLAEDGSSAVLAEFSPVYDSDPWFAVTYDVDVDATSLTLSATYEFGGETFSELLTFERLM